MKRMVVLSCLLVLACSSSGKNDGKDVSESPDIADLVADSTSDLTDAVVPDSSAADLEPGPQDVVVPHDGAELVTDVEHPEDLVDVTVDVPPEVVEPSLAIDDFLAAVSDGDQETYDAFMATWDGPRCEGTRCLFVTCLDGADAIDLRGEFNEWGQTPMTAIDFAAGCFYHLFDDLAFVHVVEYKIFANDQWYRDPLNPYFRFADVSVNSALYASGVGRLLMVEDVYSPQLDNTRNLFVYLPAPAFENAGQTFPVLYMQDGFNIFHNPAAPYGSWEVETTADQLIASGEVEPFIIVGIDTDNRYDEYLYTDVIFDLGEEFIIVDPKLPEYGLFLTETVKPLIDDTFPTRLQRENTAIAGSSLGGLSSLYLGWYHAETFGKVASFSGSFWIGETPGTANNPAMRDLMLAYEPTWEQLHLTIYLDSGSAPAGDPTPQPYTYDARCYTDWTRNALLEMGWSNRLEWDDDGLLATPPNNFPKDTVPGDVPALFWAMEPPVDYSNWDDFLLPGANLLHLVGAGQGHNEAAWALRFPAMVRFMFAD